MSNDWFLLRAGQIYGPYSPLQLQQMATVGQVGPADLLSLGTPGNWAPAPQILAFLGVQGIHPMPVPPANSDKDVSPETASLAVARTKEIQQSAFVRFQKPILAAVVGGAVVLAAAILVIATRTNESRRVENKTIAPKGTTPKGSTPAVAPKSHADAMKTRENWLKSRGAPLETHTFRKTPQVEVLVWRTGSDRYDLGTLNYATGMGTMKTSINRFGVEATIDSYHRK